MAHQNEAAIIVLNDEEDPVRPVQILHGPRASSSSLDTLEAEEQPKGYWKVVRKCLQFLFSHIGLTGLVIGYTVGGAFLFNWIEEGEWLRDKQLDLDKRRPAIIVEPDYLEQAALSVAAWKASWMDDKVLRFWHGSRVINEIYPDDWHRDTVDQIRLWEIQLNQYILQNVARMAAEIAANRTARQMEQTANVLNAPNWSFPSAFLYALSIVTTIGYGHVAPYTRSGKVATIVYAIIGIPLMLAFLANIGHLLARFFRMVFDQLFLMKTCRKVYRRRALASLPSTATATPMPTRRPRISTTSSPFPSPSPIRIEQPKQSLIVQDPLTLTPRVRSISNVNPEYEGYTAAQISVISDIQEAEKSVPIVMCVIIMGIYLFGGAVLFSVWEGWNYMDSLYFCFITLSTIGLGDMVPGATLLNISGGKGQLIVCCLYILIGLAFLASCFNLLHDSARGGIRSIGEKIGLVKQKPPSRRTSSGTLI